MKRSDFLKTVIRYMLLAFLMLISFVLGRKVVYGRDCSSCPEYAGCGRLITCTSPPSPSPAREGDRGGEVTITRGGE